MKKTACFSLLLVSFFVMQFCVAEAGATVRIMPLGDSITMGSSSGAVPNDNAHYVSYRKALSDELLAAGYDVDFVGSLNSGAEVFGTIEPADHEGHPGWTDDQLLNGLPEQPQDGNLLEWVLDHQPDVILLHVGTNSPQTSADNVEAILEEIDYYSEDVWVILARIVNRNCSIADPPCSEGATTSTFNNNLEAMAQNRIGSGDKIIIVDMEYDAGINYNLYPAGDMFDNLHPFATGYAKMAGVWFDALDQALPLVAGTNVTLDRIEISGPGNVSENSSSDYYCRAFYTNGTSRLVRANTWNENSASASISNLGRLTASEVSSNQPIAIQTSYTEGTVTANATFNVVIADTGPPPLVSGISQNGSVAQGEWVYYRIDASASDSQIVIELTNLSADVDLYVQAGAQPTLTSYYCRPYLGSTAAETCTLTNSGAATWFVGVHGYRAGSFTIRAILTGGGTGSPVTLEAGYSVDVKNDGTKYYHDGNDWVGRSSTGVLRAVNLWDISGINPAWDITAVEVRFYTESKTGSTGALSAVRYGSSHGEDDPRSDSGALVYSKSGGTAYASLPEPSSGSWTGWVNLGDVAAADIEWCRDNGRTIWSVGLKASSAVEGGTTVRHVDLSEDNEALNAELRITYTQTSPSNSAPTAVIDSISPNPASAGQTVSFTGHGVDSDGSVAAYSWTSSINGNLGSASSFSTAGLSAGTHTISFRVQDDDGAWSSLVTRSLTVNSTSNSAPTAVIDSISPNPASAGQTVSFTGHGVDSDGSVAAYSWTSSINGNLGSTSTFSSASLSAGTHTISFTVQDNAGVWSSAATASLTVTSGAGSQVALEAGYSVDVKNDGTKYYHDGNDWVGRSSTGVLRAVNLWDVSGINPAWDITAVEVRFYTESKTGSTGALSAVRYGSSHGEDDPRSDSGALVYSKSGGTAYASLPEPSSGSWTGWVNLGDVAAADIEWCRDNGRTIWSVGLKASSAVEGGTTVRHVDLSEDNEALNAELRITYTQTSPSNSAPTAVIDSISPNPASAGQTVSFTGHGVDSDGSVAAYSWTSSINGNLGSASSFSTAGLSAGTHTISFRVQDDDGAWSSFATRSLTVNSTSAQETETIFVALGYRPAANVNSKTELEALLEAMGAYWDGDSGAWIYVNQNLNKEFAIHIIQDQQSLKEALQTEGAHVVFQGHSNYGLGPVFATTSEIEDQYIDDVYYIDDPKILNISSKWISVAVDEIQTDHTFPDWLPIFRDGTNGILPFAFNDPRGNPPYNYYISYRIEGDPNLYKAESAKFGAIQRFPDSGKPAWFSPDGRAPDPNNPNESIYYIVNTAPNATTHYRRKTVLFRKDLEIPQANLKYKRLMYDSCNSGNYFLDTFNRGFAFYTVSNSDLLGFNAYLKAYLEGKSNHEIWTIVQGYDPVYDYYDFNKLPTEQ